jgi:hypothetical protein
MKRALAFCLLLFALAPLALSKIYVAPTLDTTGTFTFEVSRVITGATLAVTAGGGWVNITTDTGETTHRWVQQGNPYVATFTSIYPSIPSQFVKLAKSVTFSRDPTDTKTIIVVTNLIVLDRPVLSFAPLWKGTVTTTSPATGVVTVQDESNELNGPTFSPAVGVPGGTSFANVGTGSTGPITVQVALYDDKGIYITTVTVFIPAVL